MPKIVISSDLVRALSTLGGRSLFKTTETLALNIKKVTPVKVLVTKNLITLDFGDSEAKMIVEEDPPEIKDSYYAFQNGSVTISSDARTLERVKACLFQMIDPRRQYLKKYESKQLKRYSIDKNFINSLEQKVDALVIK